MTAPPHAPEDAGSPPSASERDIAAAAAPLGVQVAGWVLAGAGILALLITLQTFSSFVVSSTLATVALIALGAIGLGNAALGLAFARARSWAPIASAAGSALLIAATGGWLALSLSNGLVSLFALGAPALAIAACIGVVLALEPCRNVAAARERLRRAGLDLGA